MPCADSSGPVLLFDAFSLLYWAFFALPPMSTAGGEPTSALYGFSALVLSMLREEGGKSAAFALHRPGQTFRRAAFAGYKASRPAAPTPLSQQVTRVPEILESFGFPCFAVAGYEADDVLATLARELRVAGEAPLVITGGGEGAAAFGASSCVLVIVVVAYNWGGGIINEPRKT